MKFIRYLAVSVIAFTVTWNMEFSASGSHQFQPARNMSRSFKTKKEAEDFLRHQPSEKPFECVESWYGAKGVCIVRNVKANWKK